MLIFLKKISKFSKKQQQSIFLKNWIVFSFATGLFLYTGLSLLEEMEGVVPY